LVLVLFISSCTNGDTPTNLPKGVDIKFLEDQPPKELMEGQNFQVNLELINGLEKDIDFELCIQGDTPPHYEGVSFKDCMTGLINAAYKNDENILTSSKKIVYFPSETGSYAYINLEEGMGKASIYSELKYSVESSAKIDVCIKGDPYLESEEIICKNKESFSSIKQDSAPLMINKVEKNIIKSGNVNQIIVDLYLNKASQGEIVREEIIDLDLIRVDIYLTGTGGKFSCSPQKEEKIIYRPGDKIRCIGDLSVSSTNAAYIDNLNIILKYDYKVSKPISISFETNL
jgi:hypothetical protein